MSNLKSGKWIGNKAKYSDPNRRRVPRTGACKALKKWVESQKEFLSDSAFAALPQFTQQQLQNGLTNLKRQGLIRETGGWVDRSKMWEVVK